MLSFWDGAGGALIGTVGAALVAVLAIIRTRRDERDLMREQMSLTAASDCLAYTAEVRSRVDRFILVDPGMRVDWDAVAELGEKAEAQGERFFAYHSVIGPARIGHLLLWLWEELGRAKADLESVRPNRDRDGLDSVARNIGQGLTNLMDELHLYLRAELERRELRSVRIWRRYKWQRRLPLVRKRRSDELFELDDYGQPPRRY
jgi:hypothetical protein